MSSEEPPQEGEVQTGPSEEERSLWLCHVLEKDPEALELRERTISWTGAHSFGLLRRANFTVPSGLLNRKRVLELIYQHLHSIGMHHVAFTLAQESHQEFQRKDQKMDRTDLRLLVSMSLGPRDELWDDTGIESTVMSEEVQDPDNLSVNYVEKTELMDKVVAQPLEGVSFAEGHSNTFEGITFAPLCALVYALVAEQPIVTTDEDKKKFFATVNSICRSDHFFAHLKYIYNMGSSTETIKTNVLNLLSDWIHFSGLFIGIHALTMIIHFLQQVNNEIANRLIQEIPNLGYGHRSATMDLMPNPVIADPVTLLKPDLTIADPAAEEVARQISLITYTYFSAINPREFYTAISTRTLSLETPGLNDLIQFGRKLKYLIAGTILSDNSPEKCKKRIEIMVEIANMLLEINNFEALSWVVSAFDMQCIENLSGLMKQLPDDVQHRLEELRTNYSWKCVSDVYDLQLKNCYQNVIPAIPNMRYELATVAAKGYGGDDFAENRVNWGKRNIAAGFILPFIQFQDTSFNFHRISQIQKVLSAGTQLTKDQLNSLSVQIESPIKPSEETVEADQ